MSAFPLAVDMDRTLLYGDVFWIGAQRAPLACASGALLAIVGGRPLAKRIIARAARLDPSALPMRAELIAWLQNERARGRRLVLATGADRGTAEKVAAHVGLFERVFASEGRVNLKGARKAKALRRAFPGGFSYAGDSRADLAVWAHAQSAVLVGVRPSVALAIERAGVPIERVFL